jgi:hypothetical protein
MVYYEARAPRFAGARLYHRDPCNLGAGIALLLSDLFTRDQRRIIGGTLTIIGLVTTIPAIWAVCGNLEKSQNGPSSENVIAAS